MDLSFLKWPVVILVVAGLIWLGSSAGVNFMYNKFTASEPGLDPKVDARSEAGLSRLGAFLIATFRYGWAQDVLQETITRYPDGENYWFNLYRIGRCKQKLGDYKGAVQIYEQLISNNAWEMNSDIPGYAKLRLRADKLIETHQL